VTFISAIIYQLNCQNASVYEDKSAIKLLRGEKEWTAKKISKELPQSQSSVNSTLLVISNIYTS